MPHLIPSVRDIAVLAAIGLGTGWIGGAALAESEGAITVRQIQASAFRPSNNSSLFVVEQGGVGALCMLKGSGYFVAPLHLPNGAVIESVSATMQDANDDAFGMVSLLRSTPDRFEILAITPISLGRVRSAAAEVLTTTDVQRTVIDDERYSYAVQAMLSGRKVCLRGVSIGYRFSGSVP